MGLWLVQKERGSYSDVEMLGSNDPSTSSRARVRVAMNAVAKTAPKFGARVYVWELAFALTKTDGVDLVLMVGKERTDGVPPSLLSHTRRVPISCNRSYLQVFRQKRIREVLLRESIDLYHIPDSMPFLGSNTPTVVTIHDLVDLRTRKYGILRTAYRSLVNFIAAHRADHVLTVSESSKRDIVSLLRVPETKVTVVYNGVSEDFHPLDRKECRNYLASKYSVTDDFLLASGGLSRNKNIPRLLAAMCLLKERGRVESLVLLGDTTDPEFKYVLDYIRQSGLDKTVILPGSVPREDLPIFYNAARLVVYPTLYEGFGFPVLEAMACGTPVVTSNNSSLPEIAGGAALLVDPRKPEEITAAVLRLLDDDVLYAELSSRGLVHARQFTWERAARQTLAVFLAVEAKKRALAVHSSVDASS